MFNLKIEISESQEHRLVDAVEEVLKQIQAGNLRGQDSHDDGEEKGNYRFTITQDNV